MVILRNLILLCLLKTSLALFADQIGKWDWHKQFVGRIDWASFGTSKGGDVCAIVASHDDNVLAAINTKTSDLIWRQVLEVQSVEATRTKSKHRPPRFVHTKSTLLALSHDGRILRSFDEQTGILKWQITVTPNDVTSAYNNFAAVYISGANAFVYDGTSTLLGVAQRNGEVLWRRNMYPDSLLSMHDSTLATVSKRDGRLYFALIEVTRGDILKEGFVDMGNWFSISSCTIHSSRLLCTQASALHYVDLTEKQPVHNTIALPHTADEIVTSTTEYLAIIDNEKRAVSVLNANAKSPASIIIATYENAIAIDIVPLETQINFAIMRNTDRSVQWYAISADGLSATIVDKLSTKIDLNELKLNNFVSTLPKRMFVSVPQSANILIVGGDESLTFLQSSQIKWTRSEALAHVVSAEVLDLPLTESQANIEIEFGDDEEAEEKNNKGMSNSLMNVVSQTIRRVRTQMTQLRRALLQTIEEMFTLANGVSSLSNLLVGLQQQNHKVVDAANNEPFERDYFNLHKMIVVVTQAGVVYGMDNRDGRQIWSLWLGDGLDIVPTLSQLYVTRTTALHPHPARCSLIVNDRHSKSSILITLDPITGQLIVRKQYTNRIVHATFVPYHTHDGVMALLLVHDDLTAHIYPSAHLEAQFTPSLPIYVMLGGQSNVLNGYQCHIRLHNDNSNALATLKHVWRTVLPSVPTNAKLMMRPKRNEERVHSQGRVLGDRSVLYKYVNPNLVAVIAIIPAQTQQHTDSSSSHIHLFLLDAVNGAILYDNKHAHSIAPVHAVHCENWLMYTLWNEKSRRTEVNIIEMYEGEMQTDAQRFSSLAPTLSLPLVMRQSYIFAHAITAAGVTNTERGLTNRMILFALPFGGILEMQKAFLDPRRPVTPTMEQREEGLIPYMPELPIPTEHMVNYNRTTLRVQNIRTWPSGLESTTLMLATGLDMFYTRLTPSGTFDILKDDFDHWLIAAVLVALIAASFATKRYARHRDLKQAWK